MRLLLPSEPHFPAALWYFRGQSDANWGLVPSSFRVASWLRFGGAQSLGLTSDGALVTSDDDRLRAAEFALLDTLAQVVKRMGLSPHLMTDPSRVGFAQHIGLPTRLLDWSRSPWTAAYFAAAGAAQRKGDAGELAVYAISTLYLNHSRSRLQVELVDVPAAGNPNLIAQQGLLLRFLRERRDLLDGVSVDERDVGYQPGEVEGRAIDNHFLRFTLPWQLAGELLRVLRAQELHAAAIYPGHLGVAELVREVFLTSE